MSNSRNINSNVHTPDNKRTKNQNSSVVTPQHVSGHKSLHGKSVHPPLDVFNLVKRTHAKLIPRPPQQQLSINNQKMFSKRLLSIKQGVTSFMELDEQNMLKGHGPASILEIQESVSRVVD